MDKYVQNFKDILKMSPEELDQLTSPSIMDDYVKENDPEQWEKVQTARGIQDSINLGMGTAGAMKFPGKGLLGKFGPMRKSIDETESKLAKDIYDKAIGHLNPEAPNFGKVTTTELPEQALGKVTQKDLQEQALGKVIQKTTPEQALGKVTQTGTAEQAAGNVNNLTNEQVLSLMEQLKKIEHTLNTDERFLRLNELLKEKKAKKGQ